MYTYITTAEKNVVMPVYTYITSPFDASSVSG